MERAGVGLPVILTHGVGASSATWVKQVELLAGGYETVNWDLRGHGRSDAPADPALYTREAALGDMEGLVDRCNERPVLIGHSLGGYLSLAFVLTNPGRVRGLVLISTGPGYRDPDAREKWNAMITRPNSPLGVPPHVAQLGTQHDSLVIDGLSSVDIPTLLLVGEKDRRYHGGSEYMQRKLQSARLVMVPDAGHHPQETHAELVNAEIQRFFQTSGFGGQGTGEQISGAVS